MSGYSDVMNSRALGVEKPILGGPQIGCRISEEVHRMSGISLWQNKKDPAKRHARTLGCMHEA